MYLTILGEAIGECLLCSDEDMKTLLACVDTRHRQEVVCQRISNLSPIDLPFNQSTVGKGGSVTFFESCLGEVEQGHEVVVFICFVLVVFVLGVDLYAEVEEASADQDPAACFRV